jgi:hypothetical protein
MNYTFVTLTDENYFYKAKQTIYDLRTRGKWYGSIVCICVDFSLPDNFKEEYNITQISFPKINKKELVDKIGTNFPNWDGREFNKLNQWEKLHVFDDYFLQWKYVIFMDAGLRVLDSVKYLLNLDCKNKFLAPNDAGYNNKSDKIFSTQICFRDINIINEFTNEFNNEVMISQYFLNCIWIYDTNILKTIKKQEFIDYMNKYPFCKTNEMAIMNIILHFKYKLWEPFPYFTNNEKFLFDWCELNNSGTDWTNYCYIKYPVTIGFDNNI